MEVVGLSVANKERVHEGEKNGVFVDTTVALDLLDGTVDTDNTGEFVAALLAVVTADRNALTDDDSVAPEAVATTLCIASADTEAMSLLIPVPVEENVTTDENEGNDDVLDVAEEMAEAV